MLGWGRVRKRSGAADCDQGEAEGKEKIGGMHRCSLCVTVFDVNTIGGLNLPYRVVSG